MLRCGSLPCSLRLCSLLLAAALLPASLVASKPDAVPDWVRDAIAQPQAAYSAETDAVVLLDDRKLSVGADGKTVERHRRVLKILRPGGRDEGLVVVRFDKDSKILSLHVWSVGPDGREYAVKDNEIGEFGYAGGGNLYEDMRYKLVRAPGRDPGGVIAYECEQRTTPYIGEEVWNFEGHLPHLHDSFTLELPPGYSYGTTWAHHARVEAIDMEHQRFHWEMKATPAIDLEEVPMHPPLESLAGRMTLYYAPTGSKFASLGTWQGLGEWYAELSRDRLLSTPEIAIKAAELTVGKLDFYDKVEAIAEFVQKDIRYFAIEMGIGGWQPHPAGDIFRNRYGDCKDKATLLSAMLSTVGVHSALMMVDTERGVIDPDAPSRVANHMIGAIEIPAGYKSSKFHSTFTSKAGRQYLIFDPTWDKTAFGQIEHNLQGGFGVLFEGKDTEVVEIPVLSPELNTVRRLATFQLQPDGLLKGSIVEKRLGDVSEGTRYLYAYRNEKDQQTALNRGLAKDFSSFQVSDVKVENLQALNKDVTTSYGLSAERFGRMMGPLLLVRPRVLGSQALALDRKVRRVPIDLDQSMMEQDDFTIELPPEYVIDELPDPVKVDFGFAAYESSSKLTGNSLHYLRTYTVRQVSLPAARYGEVQKLAGVIEADEQNHAVLKKR